MRLLLATDEYLPHQGGAARVISETGRRLLARGHEVTILTFERDRHLPKVDEVAGVPVRRIPLQGRLSTYPRALVAGRHAVRESMRARHDLVHIHMPLVGPGALLEKGARQIPRVYSFYGPWHREIEVELRAKPLSPPFRALYGRYVGVLCRGLQAWQAGLMRRCDRVIVLSETSRQEVVSLFPDVCPDRIARIPGGVDMERFRPASDRSAVRARLGWPQHATILLTIRRLVPRMGLENLLRAFAQVAHEQRDLHLVVGGCGRLQAPLRDMAERLGVEDRVKFAGYVPEDDLPAYYQAADLFVLPTQALEGFGLITVEALASGLPVVGTPVGSTAEILGELDARFLSAGTDMAALVDGIVQGLDLVRQDGPALARLCREFAVARFDWERIVDRYEALYAELVEQRSSSASWTRPGRRLRQDAT